MILVKQPIQQRTSGGKLWMIPKTLIHSAGTIFATFDATTYSVVLGALIANTRYQLYLVPGGTLVVSSNENSIGPAGYTSWILIGAFYSNGVSSVGFGSFLNIEGKPETRNPVPYDGTFVGFGVMGSMNLRYERKGSLLSVRQTVTIGTPTAVEARAPLPFTTQALEVDLQICGTSARNLTGVAFQAFMFMEPSVNYLTFGTQTNTVVGYQKRNGTDVWTTGTTGTIVADGIPIANWTNTDIKDL